MFKNFNGFHLVDALHTMHVEERYKPGKRFKKSVEAIAIVFVTLLLWNLPSSVFGIEGLNVVQQRDMARIGIIVGILSMVLGYALLYLIGQMHLIG